MIWLLCAVAAAATLEGRVRLRGDGEPAVGARVVGPDGVEVFTDEAGRFRLIVPEPPFTLQASLDGNVVSAPVDALEPLTLWIAPGTGETEIVVEARRQGPHVAAQVLDRERVEKTPGTHDDPIRLLQALPGVAQTAEYSPSAGDLSLRGAEPGESRVYLDGVPIPYLYHFQQYASVIHTRLLDEVAVYPSTPGAAYGDSVGGVVAVSTRAPQGTVVHGGFNVNSIMLGGYVQAPLGDRKEGEQSAHALSASGRRSYLDFVESSNDQYTVWPAFWDYLGRYDRRPAPGLHQSALLIGAGDSYGRYAGDTAKLDPVEQADNPDFRFERAYHGLILTDQRRSADNSLTQTAGLVYDRADGSLGPATEARSELGLFVRSEWRHLFSEALSLGVGGDGSLRQIQREAEAADRAWTELRRESPLLSRGLSVDEGLRPKNGALWAEPRLHIGDLVVQPGLRLEGWSLPGAFAAQPRLTLRYELAEDLRLRGAIGQYAQAPTPENLSAATGDPSLPLTRSQSAALGLDAAVAGRLEFGLDGYARRIQDGLDADPWQAPAVADGAAYGLELTSRYRLRERFFAYLSGVVARSTRGDHPGTYDQPYAISAVASWDLNDHWNVGARYRYAAGQPFTPTLDALYDGDSDTYLPIEGERNSARLPDYQKVDLHVDRDLLFRRWRVNLYAEAWYVPAANNYLYTVYSYDYSESAQVVGPAFVPLLGLRAEL